MVMIALADNLFVGIGNEPAGSNGAAIARVTPDNDVVVEIQLDEQGVLDMHTHDGKLYVCGCDPTDDWTLGNIYIRSVDGTWVKQRTLPLAIHCWGACHDSNGDLWVACGCHAGDSATWQGMVMRSADDGITWDRSTVLTDYRMYSIVAHMESLYAVGTDGFAPVGKLYKSEDYGITWEHLSSVPRINWYQRPVAHNGYVVYHDLVSNDRGEWLQRNLPFVNQDHPCNCIASVGEYLYFVAGDGYIWRTTDLATWQRYSYVANAISIGYWSSQNCLVVSNKGAQAKLWRIPI